MADNTFYSRIAIDIESLEALEKKVRLDQLKPVASAFSRNEDAVFRLLSFPLVLLTTGVADKHRLVFFTQALVNTKNVSKYETSAEARAEVDAEANRLFKEASEGKTLKVVDEAKDKLGHLLGHRDLEIPARALLYTALAYAWAAFECVTKDTWTVAVNLRPKQLAQPAISAAPEIGVADGLSGKQVSVGLLARHGFDLRDKMGDLLAPKFDFTGIDGIRIAYQAAFGKKLGIDRVLESPILSAAEATRHLIVHRAGSVDEEYRRRTNDRTPIGERLQLNGQRVSEFVNAMIASGCTMMCAVDEWLATNPA